jgi:hypothetical protein
MSFSYDFNSNPNVATVRLLVSDTDNTFPLPIWQDEEIVPILNMFSSQSIIVGLSGFNPVVQPPQTFSFRRAAATLLRALAGNKARMATVGLLDAKLNGAQAANALRAIADDYVQSEENDGYFAVSEMVQDAFSMRERLWKMLYRTNNC